MKFLGLSTGAHDVGFSIMVNGVPIIHAELERYNRQKECFGDALGFYLGQKDKWPMPDKVLSFANHWHGGIDKRYPESYEQITNLGYEIEYVGHHMAHAAHAYYCSNFDEAIIFSCDGGGEEADGSLNSGGIFKGKGNKLEIVELWPCDKLNIGVPWGRMGVAFGFDGVGNQAGTVMAMAAYGTPTKEYIEVCQKWISGVEVSIEDIKAQVIFEEDKFNLAASLQFVTEEFFHDKISKLQEPTNICFTGGVMLNSLMLGKMVEWYYHHQFYVPPVPYDSGLSLGVAQYTWHHVMDNPKRVWEPFFSPYLGEEYSLPDWLKAKGQESSIYRIVELLMQGKIISLYGGRSESGRRALGNRSIIADPRSLKIKDDINSKIKHRQAFRPFAPSILEEDIGSYVETPIISPYMSFCLRIRKDKRKEIPAVIHYDGTARVQTVNKQMSPFFHALLTAWKAKTGCSVLLNTSFNDREPIVETPENAYNCFMKTDIDHLYFFDDNILI